MATSGSIKEIVFGGVNAMQAHRSAMALAGKNIANASTPNYTRQRANLVAMAAHGRVIEAQTPIAVRSSFILKSILGARQSEGFNQTHSEILKLVEPVFNDLDDSGINASMSEFFAAASEVATVPEGIPERRTFIASARYLAHTINVAHQGLEEASDTAEREIKQSTKQANLLFKEVAGLNHQIVTNQGFGDPSHELVDQQEAILEKLSTIVDIQFLRDTDNTVTVFLGSGTSMVSGIDANQLEATGGGGTPVTMEIAKFDGSKMKTMGKMGGRLGGYLQARETSIKSAMTQLDTFAHDLVVAVNKVHNAGFGLDGSTGVDLFSPIAVVAGAAKNIRVSDAVVKNPEKIAASLDKALIPGDNSNMLEMLAIQDDNTVVGGAKSLTVGYDDIVSTVAVALNNADTQSVTDAARVKRFTDLKESVTSVSLQEEMVALSQSERAFQAASRVVQAADELLNTLLKMV